MAKKHRSVVILFSLILLCAGYQALASEAVESNSYPALIRPGVYSGAGRTLSYADYFLPVIAHPDELYFLNVKTVFGNHGDSEQNIGAGFRRLAADERVIWGANGFFDARYTVNNNYVRQWGFGLEFLTPSFDLRGNAYFPTTDKQLISESDVYSFGSTSVIKTTRQIFEEPLDGFDGEAGFLVPGISNWAETRFFAGGYYYASDLAKDIPGWRLRLEVSPSPALTFECSVKDDRTIDHEFYAGGFVTLPFDIGNLFRGKNPFEGARDALQWGKGPRTMRDRMTDRIVRDIDITAKNAGVSTSVNAVNRLIYVDNTNASGTENGSKEHPYNTVAEAISASTAGAGDWIYVSPGDGTAVGYTGNYTLKDSVTLWGNGYEAFPGLGGGTAPTLEGASGTGVIVTTGGSNTIQGLWLQHANTGVGASAAGNVEIRNNTITAMEDGGGSDGSAVAVIALAAGSTINVRVEDNRISDIINHPNGDDAYGMLFSTAAVNSSVVAVTNRNTVTNTGSYGISMAVFSANSSVTNSISGNVIHTQTTDGILVVDLSGTGSFDVDMGGGSLGSTGSNSVYGQGNSNVDNAFAALALKAENNYWGGGAGTFAGAGTVDGVPFLTADPNS